MGHCNSKQQHHRQSAASASIMFDSFFSPTSASGSSSRRRRASIKQGSNISGNKNKRVAASNNDITSCSIGSAIHQKPRLVTHEGDLGSSRTVVSSSTATTANSVANSSVQADHHSNHQQEKGSSIAISSVDVYQPPPRHRNHKQQQCTGSSKGSSYSSTNKQKQRQSSSPSTHNNNINASYEVLPQVQGHGIAGQVRTCIHRSTSQHLAVKTITKSQVRRKDRIRREIAFMKQVSHPNIVQLYDVYENDKEVHLVMELCEGGELFDRIVDKAKAGNDMRKRSKKIKSQQHQQCDGSGSGSDQQQQERPELQQAHHPACYDEREAAHIVHQLLSAVSYLHSVNIIHRDIKPENILLTTHEDDNCNTDDDSSNPASSSSSSSGNDIKLIDFGLSIRHTPSCPPLKNTVGTSYYMAPELLNGTYNRSCDMWSVGVITYVMLSGRPPFNGTSDDVIFKKIRKGQYKLDNSLWDGVSDLAKDFITCLLDMDAERRWSADMALNHAWFAAAGV